MNTYIGSEFTTLDVVKKARALPNRSTSRGERDGHIHARMYNDLKSTELPSLLRDAGFYEVEHTAGMCYKRTEDGLVCYVEVHEQMQSAYISFKRLGKEYSYFLPSGTDMTEALWNGLVYNGDSNINLLTSAAYDNDWE
jgi:hypothetical protein